MKPFKIYSRSFVWIASLVSIIYTGCSKDDDPEPPPQYNMDELYAHSIADAMVADSTEVIDTLWPITADNPRLQWKTISGQSYVLMATYMRYPSSYPAGDSINNSWGESWVFIPAQMKGKLMPAFTPTSDTLLRINQLLGLPPVNSRNNTHIAEIWVPAQQLYRPAGNPAINTSSSGAALISNAPATFTNWFNANIIYSYYRSLQSATDYHYPWTRLGYTYDWAPDAKEVGLSEYVLQPGSGIWVEKVSTASDYFKN